jgi:hypothetical protein
MTLKGKMINELVIEEERGGSHGQFDVLPGRFE